MSLGFALVLVGTILAGVSTVSDARLMVVGTVLIGAGVLAGVGR